ncbi:hypothetical protein [Chryseobacterium mulctrae]|uniref:hypothetical protein n=1 Tax=Chryseobacterium mulctrae TaxID=2576777 RepID=UPI001115CE9D|nr:hypothetical protein [Chryseobacterium mulctrae]
MKKFLFFVGRSQRRKVFFCYKLFLRRKDLIFDKVDPVVVVVVVVVRNNTMILKINIHKVCLSVGI